MESLTFKAGGWLLAAATALFLAAAAVDSGFSAQMLIVGAAALAACWFTISRADYPALVRGVTSAKGAVNRTLREGGSEIPARTRYRRLEVAGGHSLLEVHPEQGRKHQVRRHLAGLGHPVIGDRRYGHDATNRHFEERYGLDRSFLHCQSITFGTRSREHAFESPLPAELRATLAELAGRYANMKNPSGPVPISPGVLLSR